MAVLNAIKIRLDLYNSGAGSLPNIIGARYSGNDSYLDLVNPNLPESRTISEIIIDNRATYRIADLSYDLPRQEVYCAVARNFGGQYNLQAVGSYVDRVDVGTAALSNIRTDRTIIPGAPSRKLAANDGNVYTTPTNLPGGTTYVYAWEVHGNLEMIAYRTDAVLLRRFDTKAVVKDFTDLPIRVVSRTPRPDDYFQALVSLDYTPVVGDTTFETASIVYADTATTGFRRSVLDIVPTVRLEGFNDFASIACVPSRSDPPSLKQYELLLEPLDLFVQKPRRTFNENGVVISVQPAEHRRLFICASVSPDMVDEISTHDAAFSHEGVTYSLESMASEGDGIYQLEFEYRKD